MQNGGSGFDEFIYKRAEEGGDTINYFELSNEGRGDHFHFRGDTFGNMERGTLHAAQFKSGNSDIALTADVRFFYETVYGILRYDSDGTASAAAMVIATLVDGNLLTADGILIF